MRDNGVTGKVPPQSLDAELSVLGGILIDNRAIKKVLGIVDKEDFYRECHRKIFSTMIVLAQKKEPIDLITLTDTLKSFGMLEEVGGAGFVACLADDVATTANIEYYCNIIKEKAMARSAINLATDVIGSMHEGGDVQEAMGLLRHGASQITAQHSDVEVHTMKEIVKTTFNSLEEVNKKGDVLTGVSTGFRDLNKATSGFQPGDFIILAGRPSMGKSILADNFLDGGEVPAAFFSLEMSKERYCKRSLSSSGSIDHGRTVSAHFAESDWPKLTKAAGELSEKQIYVIDKSNLHIDKIVSISERLYEEKGIRMIVIDYLQFIVCSGRTKEQEVSEISRKLKGLAKDLNIPVIALAQFSRKVDERWDKRPMLSDLRDSGSLEQDADVVMSIYRPAYPDYGFTDDDIDKLYRGMTHKPSTIEDLAELDIMKGRDMKLGTIFLTSELKYQRFTDYTSGDKWDV